MAISATLAVDTTTPTSGFKANFVLTVSNSGGAAVNIQEITPFVDANADALAKVPTDLEALKVLAITGKSQIPAGGSLTYSWPAVYFTAPKLTPAYPAGVTVRTDDGSVTTSNVLSLTVSTPAY